MTPLAIPNLQKKLRIAIIGGGPAGLAAATALQNRLCSVEIFETRRQLGGRAGSFIDPIAGHAIDRCQHVAMGCCTDLIEFCRQNAADDLFTRYKTFHFIAPDANRYDFSATRWLPPPLHLGPALMRLKYLNLAERLGIMSALRRLLKANVAARGAGSPKYFQPDEPVEHWLRRQGQSDHAINCFWAVVLESALSEKLGRASLAAARKIFADGFMATRSAYELLVPRFTLSEIFDRRIGGNLERQGVAIHRRTRVTKIDGNASAATSLVLSDGTKREFDAFIVAVPWHKLKPLLSPPLAGAMPMLDGLAKISAAPITSIHLWHERPITKLPHAVFIGRLGQWFFNHGGGYSQVLISASHGLVSRKSEDVCREIAAELQGLFPAANATRLVRSRLITEPRAVFSLQPGVDELRPQQKTPIPNLALAGDWTDTAWPATMEGAVRSGYMAAEVFL